MVCVALVVLLPVRVGLPLSSEPSSVGVGLAVLRFVLVGSSGLVVVVSFLSSVAVIVLGALLVGAGVVSVP